MAIRALEDLWLMNAAGMVKTVEDMLPLLKTQVSHIVIGGATVEPRPGNPEPTFWPSPDGRYALNSRGLPNRGLDYYRDALGDMHALAKGEGKKLVFNCCSSRGFDDWTALASVAAEHPEVILELNVSCPNKWKGACNEPVIAQNPEAVRAILEEADRVAFRNEKWLKVPPYPDPRRNPVLRQIVKYAADDGPVDALVLCNAIGGQKPPVVDGKPVIGMPTAGKSGRILKQWSLLQNRVIGELAPDIPRVGIGGIYAGADIEDYRQTGVAGVAIGTAFFAILVYGVFGDLLPEAA